MDDSKAKTNLDRILEEEQIEEQAKAEASMRRLRVYQRENMMAWGVAAAVVPYMPVKEFPTYDTFRV